MEHQTIIAAPAADAIPTIIIARPALLEALAILKRDVVERRNTIPILAGVLFQPLNDTGDGVAIIGTDLDIRATFHVPAIFTDGRPFVVASCAALHDAVKASKAAEITLELRDGKLRLSGGGSSATLGTLPAADFPEMIAGDMAAEFTLPGAALAHDLVRVSPAISTEETRYYLNGIFIHTHCDQPAEWTEEHEALATELRELKAAQHAHECAEAKGLEGQDDPETAEARTARIGELKAELDAIEAVRSAPDSIRFAATDGHRLCVATRPLPEGAATLPAGIIPRKVCALVGKLVGKPSKKGSDHPDVLVQLSGTKIAARIGNAFILAKLIDGTFPDYTRVLPTMNDKVLSIGGDGLADAIKSATAHCSDKARAVKLSVSSPVVTVSATDPEHGTGTATIAASWRPAFGQPDDPAPEDFEIGFNASYLSGVASLFGAEGFELHMADAAAPSLLVSPAIPGFKAVLMPMRVGGESTPAKPSAPVEAPNERLRRVYRAAFAAGDYAGVKRAVAEFHTAAPNATREDMAYFLADIRAEVAERPADAGVHLASRKRAELRAKAVNVTAAGMVADRASGGVRSPGSFKRLGEFEAAIAAIAILPGYDPADPRNVLPVQYDGLGLVYVAAHELRDPRQPALQRRDAKGAVTRKRGESNVLWRDRIRSVVPAKMSPADLAMALLKSEADRRELGDRLARLESLVADMASRPAAAAPEPAPPAPEPEPAIPPAPAPEPSVLGTIIAELAERAEVAEAAAERASRPRGGLVAMIGRLRERCAAAVRRADAAEAELRGERVLVVAQKNAIAALAARAETAEAELAKLQPLAAAIRSLAIAA
jgi:DNA polymerase-3 subunit beta